MANRYEELVVWQKAMALALAAVRLSEGFPKEERFGLVSQFRRSAFSVPSNIAEGQGRLTRGEFRQFLGIARGSLFEIETQARLALMMGYVKEESMREFLDHSAEVARLLNGLIGAMR